MLAERLKLLRQQQHLSQMALSKLLGVSQQTVGSWETGRTSPDNAMVTTLAKHFDVSTDYLLGHEKTNNITIGNYVSNSTVRGDVINEGNNTYYTTTDSHCNDVMQALFGHSKEAMEVLKHIRIDSQGNISNIDVTDKATIKALAETMILQLKAAQARADSKITVPAK